MNIQSIFNYCLAKHGAYFNNPFGAEPVCARIGKRIFAEIYPSRAWVTLRCDPVYGLAMREAYPGTVRRGYYCPPSQQPHHNTVTLDGTVPDDVLLQMIDHSYESALKSLTRAQRADALASQE
ncbi:MAG: MmcQ/YjbR family DNA-binding protein [Eubacteriales bacterium]|nr:MmcQ/YjbR family DNA-binding protein [Eubacteriales bacterium]